jgi:hypothetical protein
MTDKTNTGAKVLAVKVAKVDKDSRPQKPLLIAPIDVAKLGYEALKEAPPAIPAACSPYFLAFCAVSGFSAFFCVLVIVCRRVTCVGRR